MVARFGAQKNLMYTSQNVLGVFVPAFELERKKVGQILALDVSHHEGD